MPFGFLVSMTLHAALLAWALLEIRGVQPPVAQETPSISADVISPSEFLRLKQGSEDAKKLETKAKEEAKPDDSKNDTKKPDNAPPPPPPPPPQDVAKAEELTPPEPPKPDPPKPPEPDPIEDKLKEAPPPTPPAPAAGPTAEEQKLLEQKIEEQRKADEAKKKAEDAKKKADEAKKKEEEARKKKIAEAKKKAEQQKQAFNSIDKLLNKLPDDAEQKALLDKDPRVKGQQAAGTSQAATATGKEAGTSTGKEAVLSAREQDLLAGMIKSAIEPHWRLPGSGGGTEVPVVKLRWRLDRNGNLDGEPVVEAAPSDELGRLALETAVRAVKEAQPFALPPDKYEAWKDIIWTFDPRQLL